MDENQRALRGSSGGGRSSGGGGNSRRSGRGSSRSSGGSSRSRTTRGVGASSTCVVKTVLLTNVSTYDSVSGKYFFKLQNITSTSKCVASSGSLIAIIVPVATVFLFGLAYVLRKRWTQNQTQQTMGADRRVEACEHLLHKLTDTNCQSLVNQGNQSYSTGWICDKCNRNHGFNDPIKRCMVCMIDVCVECQGNRPVPTFAHQITNNFGYGYNAQPYWQQQQQQAIGYKGGQVMPFPMQPGVQPVYPSQGQQTGIQMQNYPPQQQQLQPQQQQLQQQPQGFMLPNQVSPMPQMQQQGFPQQPQGFMLPNQVTPMPQQQQGYPQATPVGYNQPYMPVHQA